MNGAGGARDGKPKLLLLVSPQGDAMLREVDECRAAFARDFDVLVLASPAERARFSRDGAAFKRWRPAGLIGMATSISKLRRTAERFVPDVIHAHGFPAIAVALGTFPAPLAARTIGTFHDPQRDKELPQKLVERKMPAYLRRCAVLTATYPSLARALEKRLLLDDPMTVVPHGVAVELGDGRPLARPVGRAGPIVGWRGALSADRAWETALDAFAKVRARFPGATMQIAGRGRARQFIAAHARHAGLADAVTFRGELPVREFTAAIDVLIVPVSRDAQPHAPLEALVAGVPVVAANAGALADALRDLSTAWLVPDDPDGFAAGVADVWSRIDAAWEGAAGQRAAARDLYGRDTVVTRYRALYERCLAPGDSPPLLP